MTRKLIILIIAAITFPLLTGCGIDSRKNKISSAMREYVEPTLKDGETYGFVGLSNNRDTTFMGAVRPCVGVIYTVTDARTGEKKRHFADVILTEDYSRILNVSEPGFDPVEYAGERIHEAFNRAFGK